MGFGASRDLSTIDTSFNQAHSAQRVSEETAVPRTEEDSNEEVPSDANAHDMTATHGDTEPLIPVYSVLDPNQENSCANFSPMMTFQVPAQTARAISNLGGPLHDSAEDTAVIEEFELEPKSAFGNAQESGNTITELPNFSHITATSDAFSPEESSLQAPSRHHAVRSGGAVSIVAGPDDGLAVGMLRTTSGGAGHHSQRHNASLPIDGQESSGKSHTASRSVDASLRVRFDFSTSRAVDGASSFSTLCTAESQRALKESRDGGEGSFSVNDGEPCGNGSFVKGSTMKLAQFHEVS